MKIEEKFERLFRVADFLKDSGTKILLKKWREHYESGIRELAFVGRFSAGKSSLLNVLIDPVLPIATVETTAALTKIGYGPTAGAMVVYNDGHKETIGIEELKKLSHSDLEGKEKEIREILVTLPHGILQGGLVLVDSPGMDTILNNHVAIAEEIMQGALSLVYVMASSPSDFDIAVLNKIQKNNVEVVVVRTHLDEIRDHEESVESVIENDRTILADKLEKKVEYFALSDRPSKPLKPIVDYEMEKFMNFLQNYSKKENPKYLETLNDRLHMVAREMEGQLSTQIHMHESSYKKDSKQIESEIESLKSIRRKAMRELDNIHSQARKELTSVKLRVDDVINYSIKHGKAEYQRILSKALEDPGELNESKLQIIYHDFLSNCIETAGNEISEIISEWSRGRVKEIEDALVEVKSVLAHADVDFDGSFNMAKVNEITERQEALLEEYQDLCAMAEELSTLNDRQLQELNMERESINKVIQELENVHAEYGEAIKALNDSYSPRYIEKPSTLGKIFKRIGTVGDIAMLLIPAAGWTKAGTLLSAKAATLASKGGVLANAGAKALKGLSAATKVIASTDAAKDMTYLLDIGMKVSETSRQERGMQVYQEPSTNQRIDTVRERIESYLQQEPSPQQGQKKKRNFFDYLSLSYWFEKAGEMIDPPTVEIDKEYEARFSEAKATIENEARVNIQRQMEEYRKLGLIKSREDEIKFKKQSEQLALNQKEKRLKRENEFLENQKKSTLKEVYRAELSSKFLDSISSIMERLAKRVELTLEGLSDQIASAASFEINNRMERIEQQLQEILFQREGKSETNVAELGEYNDLLALLKFND